MPIYTRTGDKGETSLFGGKRISKSNVQVEAYGRCDELTAHLGLIRAKRIGKNDKKLLLTIQHDLYEVMAFLAGAPVNLEHLPGRVKEFEQIIDKEMSRLPKLKRFVLPGGTENGALFQIARTLVRRAERGLIDLLQKRKVTPGHEFTRQYLNRMSDLFFALGRKYTKGKEVVT